MEEVSASFVLDINKDTNYNEINEKKINNFQLT